MIAAHSWTQQESIEFESAKELLTHIRALLFDFIESHPMSPARAQIELALDITDRIRQSINITEPQPIAQVRRAFGPLVRSWHSTWSDQTVRENVTRALNSTSHIWELP